MTHDYLVGILVSLELFNVLYQLVPGQHIVLWALAVSINLCSTWTSFLCVQWDKK